MEFGPVYARTAPTCGSDVVEHCYRLTPTALHRGWVEAQERIITACSGQYGWDDAPYDAQILLFNADGSLQPNPVLRGQQGKVTVQVPELGIAILERTDVP